MITSLFACSVTENSTSANAKNPQRSQLSQNSLPQSISQAVLRDASRVSGLKISDLKITQVTSTIFSNPCIFQFGEVCTKEYNPIPGWTVIVQVKEQSWIYHVNKSGSQILLDPKISNNQLPKKITNGVLSDASKRSGIKVSDLQITQVTSTIFSNPCIFKFGEVCTREYNPIPGWVITVRLQKQSWIYHVNKSDSQILLDPKITTHKLSKKIANMVLSDASKRSGLAVNYLKITQSTQKTFSNSCVFNFGEVCAQIFDPIAGWEVIVKVKSQFWTYHVDNTGTRMVLDPKITKIRLM
jgi:uncharacterized protein YcnI